VFCLLARNNSGVLEDRVTQEANGWFSTGLQLKMNRGTAVLLSHLFSPQAIPDGSLLLCDFNSCLTSEFNTVAFSGGL